MIRMGSTISLAAIYLSATGLAFSETKEEKFVSIGIKFSCNDKTPKKYREYMVTREDANFFDQENRPCADKRYGINKITIDSIVVARNKNIDLYAMYISIDNESYNKLKREIPKNGSMSILSIEGEAFSKSFIRPFNDNKIFFNCNYLEECRKLSSKFTK